ncbi:M17 family peptidase N-terminal domain-containing protein, partial [Sphingorhabdus sp.]
MDIRFASQRPEDADVLGFVLTKSTFETFAFPLENPEAARETAKLARFEGAAGQSFLYIASEQGRMVRIVLLGVAEGDTADFSKAGGELLAKVQTCGAKKIILHAENLSGKAAAEVAFGAAQRNWRIDKYRTKLAETAKPSVTEFVVVCAPDDATAVWQGLEAVAAGTALTKELVSEPANVIYPESFVERCLHLKELGVEITVLDDKQMT